MLSCGCRVACACVGGALPSDLKAFVNRIRSVTDRQLAVGFGISTPEQVPDKLPNTP
jgi:tryptophan synthase alpha subunit